MSDFDDVNFPVTVVHCVSPFRCHLNSRPIGVIQQQNFKLSSTLRLSTSRNLLQAVLKLGLQPYDLLTKTQQLLTAPSLDRHYGHVQKSKPLTIRYQVMLTYLTTDTDVVECIPIRALLAFVRT
jgi:hypothetical protein